jgi:hypothetical protein
MDVLTGWYVGMGVLVLGAFGLLCLAAWVANHDKSDSGQDSK